MLLIIPVLYGVVAAAVAVRSGCSEDNCLRAIVASNFPTRHGTADCSSYFMTTVTPATFTFTATVSTTVPTFAVELVPRAPAPTIARRQTTLVPSSIPTYASACSGSVRYSSACSCIGVTGATTTALAPSTTVTVTATSTITEVANCPTFTVGDLAYSVYYSGSGFTENTKNPGNDLPDYYPPITTTYPGSTDPCTAIQACTQNSASDPDAYYSFDLHYLASTQEWECVSYYDPNTTPSYYNVPNPDVVIAYGYSLPLS